jgi:hypothetical protein
VEEVREIEVVKPGTAWKAALKIVFVYVYQATKYCSWIKIQHSALFISAERKCMIEKVEANTTKTSKLRNIKDFNLIVHYLKK